MQRILLIMALAFSATSGSLLAQANNTQAPQDTGITDQQQRDRFWEANLGGGQYMVALSHITAISRHQYVLDGSLLVDEVTVDTNGQAPARFYFITPITDEMRGSGIGNVAGRMVDRGREIAERGAQVGGTQIHEMVQKKFPLTTHSKQIEYRVLSSQALGQLYDSVRSAWRTGRGRVFTIN